MSERPENMSYVEAKVWEALLRLAEKGLLIRHEDDSFELNPFGCLMYLQLPPDKTDPHSWGCSGAVDQ